MWIYVDEDFYASVEEKADGSKSLLFGDYEKGFLLECNPDSALIRELLSSLVTTPFTLKRKHDEGQDDDSDYNTKTLPATKRQKEERENEPEKEEDNEKEEQETEEEAEEKEEESISLENPTPAPPTATRRLNFEDEFVGREKEMRKKLSKLYAEQVYKHLSVIMIERCYGCQYDRPSQTDHDVCCNTSFVDIVELYLEEAISRMKNSAVYDSWVNRMIELFPSEVSAMEMIRYSDKQWVQETVNDCNNFGIEQLKDTIVNTLLGTLD